MSDKKFEAKSSLQAEINNDLQVICGRAALMEKRLGKHPLSNYAREIKKMAFKMAAKARKEIED